MSLSQSAVLLGVAGLALADAGACTYPGKCYDMRLQRCTEGPSKGHLTLHGLWPEWSQGCAGEKFDEALLAPIRAEMEAKWPSCPPHKPESPSQDLWFWEHEWTKHGTCSGLDQLAYFKKALSLADDHKAECGSQEECNVCLSVDFEKVACSPHSSRAAGPVVQPAPQVCTYPGKCFDMRLQRCEEGATKGQLTLHGLWPQWSQGCKGEKFDEALLAPIRAEMEAKWPSCPPHKPESPSQDHWFWEHEWSKHGTCTGLDQLSYFRKALALADQHKTECGSAEECNLCFTVGFDSVECARSSSELPGRPPALKKQMPEESPIIVTWRFSGLFSSPLQCSSHCTCDDPVRCVCEACLQQRPLTVEGHLFDIARPALPRLFLVSRGANWECTYMVPK